MTLIQRYLFRQIGLPDEFVNGVEKLGPREGRAL